MRFYIFILLLLSACKSELRVDTIGGRQKATAAAVQPPFAKSNDVVTVTGTNFSTVSSTGSDANSGSYKAVFETSTNETVDVKMSVVKADTATFIFPSNINTD